MPLGGSSSFPLWWYWRDRPWGDRHHFRCGGTGAIALIDLLALPFRSTVSHSIFRLAVINGGGGPATVSHLLARWGIIWLPLILPISFVALLINRAEGLAFLSALVLLLLWGSAAVYAVVHPHRGLHDRLAGTWVVRR